MLGEYTVLSVVSQGGGMRLEVAQRWHRVRYLCARSRAGWIGFYDGGPAFQPSLVFLIRVKDSSFQSSVCDKGWWFRVISVDVQMRQGQPGESSVSSGTRAAKLRGMRQKVAWCARYPCFFGTCRSEMQDLHFSTRIRRVDKAVSATKQRLRPSLSSGRMRFKSRIKAVNVFEST